MRYGRLVRNAIGLLAVLAMILGPLLAHFAVVPPLAGFAMFALGGIVSILVGLASLVQRARGRPMTTGGGLALLAALVFVGLASSGGGHPRINDFTTDLADPPAFRHAGSLPRNAGRDMAYPAHFAQIQRECCADLRAAKVATPPADAYAKAVAVARRTPTWTVTHEDPDALALEAVSSSALFRFQDDVAIRVRPESDGTSRVDVRSKSRDGQGDMGVNAARIRAYVGELEAAK
jgi:uncharacterized protein (DUF1499 family)